MPSGPGWVHEVKHDGYRLQVRREGDEVHLFTRRGYDWSKRYPAIVRTAAALRSTSFTIDGEAVVYGSDGVAIFDALHRAAVYTPLAMSTNSERLDQFEEGNAARGHAGEVEAVRRPAVSTSSPRMTARRLPTP